MEKAKPFHALMDGRFAFFQEFLRHPLQVASIIPSSRFLERRVVATAGVHCARTIVELGPGTGGTTRAILHAMGQKARLLSIEINQHLHTLVCRIQDDRLIAHLGNAQELSQIISMYRLGSPEVVISGIPFSTLSHTSGSQILKAISSTLSPGGCFVAYQVSKRVASVCRPFLGKGQVEIHFLNIPPLRVYRWEKNCGQQAAGMSEP